MDLRPKLTRLRALPADFARLKHFDWRRRGLSLSLIVVGVLLLAYVISQYFGMFSEQRRLAQQWEQENARAAAAASNGQKASTSFVDDGLTRLSIPTIDLDAVVVEGASRKQLAVAPGHLKDTATPGENGNAVITAHRDTFFRHIYELNKGDNIVIRRRGEVFKFEVTGRKIVDPQDVTVLRKSKDARLTLITCYPTYYIGPAPERLVVFSKLVERSSQEAASNQLTSNNP